MLAIALIMGLDMDGTRIKHEGTCTYCRICCIDVGLPSSSLHCDQSQYLDQRILPSSLGLEQVNLNAEEGLEYYEAWKGSSRDGSLVVEVLRG